MPPGPATSGLKPRPSPRTRSRSIHVSLSLRPAVRQYDGLLSVRQDGSGIPPAPVTPRLRGPFRPWLAAVAAALLVPGMAAAGGADGDPASDVLPTYPLFLGSLVDTKSKRPRSSMRS